MTAGRPSRLERALRAGEQALESVAVALLVSTIVVTLAQVFFRYVLNASLNWPEEAARWGFIWFVFLAMAVGVRRGTHITINLVPNMLSPRWRFWHQALVRTFIATVCWVLLVHGADLVGRSSYVSPALGWPFTYFYLAVPTGAGLTLFVLVVEPVVPGRARLAGLGCALAGAGLYWLLHSLGADLLFAGSSISLPLFTVSLALILFGVPIAFALVLGTFAAFVGHGDLMMLTLTQNMTSALDSFLLLAIPFFILTAGLMNASGITERLIALAAALVGHLRGGLGHVNVLTSTLMGGISGSSLADAGATAKALIPKMERNGYSREFSCAVTSASSVLANLIPPSLGLIIYAALAQASVGALFVASIVPGLMMALALAVTVHLVSLRHNYGSDRPRATARERGRALWVALPALLLPVAIIGGVRFGVFTATEAGAVATLYALFCGFFLYRAATPGAVLSTLRDALSDTVAVAVVIAAAAPFAYILVLEQVPQMLAREIGGFATSAIMLLLLINGFLIAAGLVIEMIAALVILVPIFLPMVKAAGVDPVHFGIIIVANLVIGALTPPLGMLVFVTARVADAPVARVFRATLPFILALLVVLALITFIPALSLGLLRIIAP
ncbi:MAG: TRAP transporter large permease subunit [Hyphomicrobiales bacterium]